MENLAQLFEAEARRRPDAIAVDFGEAQIKYDELNRRANQLAHYLREQGVRAVTPVGLCLERSPEMIIALLGILKAGGGYVALDPSYPKERLALMLANAAPPLLLTTAELHQRLPDHEGRLVLLETERAALDTRPDENLEGNTTSDDLAYISYTSGSSGIPKGVAIPQRGVVRLVKSGGFARVDENETFLQLSPVGFDASTFEIWGALLNGGRLVVMAPHVPSLKGLGETLRAKKVTTLWLTAGLFHLMIDEQLDDLRGLRQLIAGGDVLSPAHVRAAFEALPNCQLINGYGPTENTTFTCCHSITTADLDGAPIPIGEPIGKTTVHILDESMQPSEMGELYIGGEGLALGYWRQPELTAAKFVHLFDSKLYRSGDLVRQRADGVIEFIGRADDQVKISGYRIELGEIETALRRHEQVRDAVVLALGEGIDRKRLVAYFIPNAHPPVGLRDFLRQTLPDYMLPTDFISVESFPLTSNGKVDRRALAGRDSHPIPHSAPPQTELERTVSGIWREIIDPAGEIGIDDNFFDFGGNSLRAVQAHARLARTLDASLPLTALFQYPTIRSLSRFLDTKADRGTSFAGISARVHRQRAARAQRSQARLRP